MQVSFSKCMTHYFFVKCILEINSCVKPGNTNQGESLINQMIPKPLWWQKGAKWNDTFPQILFSLVKLTVHEDQKITLI